MPYEAEERQTVRQKLRLDSNKCSIEYYLFFFLAVNTFFLALGELIYFSQSTFNCKSIVHCFTINKSNLRNFFFSNVFIDKFLKIVKRILNY